jgi:molybdopterin-containing oxidoreductase family membrane subunit
VPLSLWVKKLRRNIRWTFFVALVINIGMWFERFDIIVVDLSKDRLTSSWTMFQPTFVDIGTFIGTIGFFFVLFLLYARTFPVIAQAEVKTILKSSGESFKRLRAEHGDDHSHIQTVEEYPADAGPAANVEGKHFDSVFDDSNEEDSENNEVDFELHRGKIDNLLSSIGTFNPEVEKQDDLKKISGVGPVMEQKLHQLGIFTFEQVSRMTDREYDLLDEIISEFPGRAKRDDWAGQALTLKNNN